MNKQTSNNSQKYNKRFIGHCQRSLQVWAHNIHVLDCNIIFIYKDAHDDKYNITHMYKIFVDDAFLEVSSNIFNIVMYGEHSSMIRIFVENYMPKAPLGS